MLLVTNMDPVKQESCCRCQDGGERVNSYFCKQKIERSLMKRSKFNIYLIISEKSRFHSLDSLVYKLFFVVRGNLKKSELK